MNNKAISDDIRRFILIQISSVPYLEAILLLRGEPLGVWDRARLAHYLYLSETACGALLEQLVVNGVAAVVQQKKGAMADTWFQYQPVSPALIATIDELAHIYSQNLVAVTHLIHSKPNKKAQRFADAFVWRKET